MESAAYRGVLVGIAQFVFPILHSITDGMEWLQGAFSALQLWLNYSSLPTVCQQ